MLDLKSPLDSPQTIMYNRAQHLRYLEPTKIMADIEQHTPTEKLFREKILHALEVFPFLSNSMIHMAIGTSNSTLLWKPVLETLVAEGKIVETTHTAKTPIDRQQSYTIYHLPKYDYNNFLDGSACCGV